MPEFEKFLAQERYRTRTKEIAAIGRTTRRALSRYERQEKKLRRVIALSVAVWLVVTTALLTQNARSDERKGKDATGDLLATQAQEAAFTEAEIIEPQLVSLGQFRITHYCACEKCCGKTDGIDGRICYYTAEDCGGAIKGNEIDVYVDSHEEALELGVTGASVYLVNEVK